MSDDFPDIEGLPEFDTGLLDLTKLEGKHVELFGLKAAHLNGKNGRSLNSRAPSPSTIFFSFRMSTLHPQRPGSKQRSSQSCVVSASC